MAVRPRRLGVLAGAGSEGPEALVDLWSGSGTLQWRSNYRDEECVIVESNVTSWMIIIAIIVIINIIILLLLLIIIILKLIILIITLSNCPQYRPGVMGGRDGPRTTHCSTGPPKTWVEVLLRCLYSRDNNAAI